VFFDLTVSMNLSAFSWNFLRYPTELARSELIPDQ
jgi:hypothetical protein